MLAQIVTALPEAVFVVDLPERTIREANTAAEAMFGYTREELIGAPTRLLHVDDEHYGRFHEAGLETLKRGKVFRTAWEMRRRDGTCFHSQHAVSVVGGEQPPRMAVSIVWDVTERHELEKRLRESEEWHRLTLANISDAVLLTDDDGAFVQICPNVGVIFGRNDDEVRRMGNVRALLGTFEPLPEDAATQQSFEVRVQDAAGRSHDLLVTNKRVDIQGGTHLLTCRDVTELVEQRNGLQAALREVKRLRDKLQGQNLSLQEEIRATKKAAEMIGDSPAFRRVREEIARVAATDSTVLVTGETGTGKELVVRELHARSRRAGQPLLSVNCAAVATHLVESELFGHERGAFTGADRRRLGRFELADGGTIFLDEVGELELETQAKLLRVLEQGTFERIGTSETRTVDVRVLAATNRDLHEAVREGRFRQDLLYRLDVVNLHVPPLREREGDVRLLADAFLQVCASRVGRPFEGFTPAAHEALERHAWPGNVRELRNVVERASLMADPPRIDAADLLLRRDAEAPSGPPGRRLEDVQREHIRRVLEETGGVIEGEQGAAAVLGLSPSTLRSRMKKLGLDRGA